MSQFYEKVADNKGWGINPDKEIVECVVQGLEHNRDTYGKMYCPCLVEHSQDTICPCKEFRGMKNGMCHCGLYIKE